MATAVHVALSALAAPPAAKRRDGGLITPASGAASFTGAIRRPTRRTPNASWLGLRWIASASLLRLIRMRR